MMASLVLWAASCTFWVTLLAVEQSMGCPGFSDPSGFADKQTWSWLPPGNSCVYRIAGQTHVDSPPTARLAVLGLLVLWPLLTFVFVRAARGDAAET